MTTTTTVTTTIYTNTTPSPATTTASDDDDSLLALWVILGVMFFILAVCGLWWFLRQILMNPDHRRGVDFHPRHVVVPVIETPYTVPVPTYAAPNSPVPSYASSRSLRPQPAYYQPRQDPYGYDDENYSDTRPPTSRSGSGSRSGGGTRSVGFYEQRKVGNYDNVGYGYHGSSNGGDDEELNDPYADVAIRSAVIGSPTTSGRGFSRGSGGSSGGKRPSMVNRPPPTANLVNSLSPPSTIVKQGPSAGMQPYPIPRQLSSSVHHSSATSATYTTTRSNSGSPVPSVTLRHSNPTSAVHVGMGGISGSHLISGSSSTRGLSHTLENGGGTNGGAQRISLEQHYSSPNYPR